ncbi:MAG: L,D-transpeptidase [Candidatus Curtissbacteria bacterium]|nr:L,D-transpeptidase [Candidatus Curtissbacteria bacterium]
MAYQNAGMAVGINLNNIATASYVNFIKSQSGQYENASTAIWLNQKIAYNNFLAEGPERSRRADANVLGNQSPADPNKWIDINLSEQRLYMKQGASTVASFLVSTGKWAPTPTGTFAIWTKLRYTTMAGGNQALGTYYNLPNVPYVMYFYQGYGMHGAYWHNNFGQRMSHGCVNMRPEEAGIVFNWADVGTRVVVHD